jgi:Double-GTPase 2
VTEGGDSPVPEQEPNAELVAGATEPTAEVESSPDLDTILDSEGSTAISGDGLNDLEAEALCASARCTVVVLAGGVGSGKTTLLTSIYEQLNQQSFGPYLFAGSETLFGFEKRAHGWREAAGMAAPMTATTAFSQPPWLHLLLRKSPPARPHQLLMADLSGEHFERLVSGERTPDSFPMLSRADHVAVVLNGRKLAEPKERQTERSRAEQLLRVLAAPGVLASTKVVSIVVAKLDRYLQDGRADDIDDIAARLQGTAGIEHSVSLFRTAAQPHSAKYPMGHGVDALLAHWLDNPIASQPSEPQEPAPAESAYSRFGLVWSEND